MSGTARERGSRRLWIAAGAAALLATVALGVLTSDLSDPPHLLLFVGRFHPMVVHFPIGLLVLAALLEAFALVRPLRALRQIAPLVLFLGAVTAVASAGVGFLLSLEGGYDEELVSRHMWLGIATAVGAAAAAALRMVRRPSPPLRRAYLGTLGLTVAALLAAGHLGGSLTHGSGYLTYYMPAPLRAMAGVTEASAATHRVTDIDSARVYHDLIAPVLQARCASCHSADKRKGGLRLDTPEGLSAGGEGGVVVVAGSPDQSELLRRMVLPPGHEDAMPPDGADPVPVGETELIRWWIASGASMDARVAELGEIPSSVATLFARIAPPRPERRAGLYALDVPPPDPRAVAAAAAAGFGVAPVSQDVALLQVTTVNARATVDDDALRRLLPIAQQVTWLDLSGTRVSDAGMAVLARMPNLTRLHLGQTAVGDAGLRHLAGLAHLEYLNLYGTRVGNAGLQSLQGMSRLGSVYLWGTGVTADGAERLRGQRPGLQVVLGAAPPPAP